MIQVVILAAGKSRRMNSSLPKILHKIKSREMINYLLEQVARSGVCPKPIIVVGRQKELVKKILGRKYCYLEQKEQLGTGHALMVTKKCLEAKARDILVLYGDHPLVSAASLKKLAYLHKNKNGVLTLMTSRLSDFKSWRRVFRDNFGRVIRNERGEIINIVEKSEATIREKRILEINPGYYCFKSSWLWPNIGKLENNNQQGEYYLTDMIKIAVREGEKIFSIPIRPRECLGINTQEELKLAEKIIDGKIK